MNAPGLSRSSFLGVEPAIEIDGRRHVANERRLVSARWLIGTILTGAAGTALIATALFTALERRRVFIKQPEYAVQSSRDETNGGTSPKRGDRLVRKADIVAERQSFQAPTTVTVGDKQVIRLRGYTHVGTTLTLVPTDLADQVPPFNPLKLLNGDEPSAAPDLPPDPGPALDASEVGFVTSDLNAADPALFGPGLSKDDAAAQVAEQIRMTSQVGAKATIALPPQFFLMRANRTNALAFAGPDTQTGPFSSISVRMTPENVMVVPRTEAGHDSAQLEDRLVVLRHGDTLDGLLQAAGASRDEMRAMIQAFGAARGEPPVAEGRRIRFTMTSDDGASKPRIARLSIYADETLETTIALTDDNHYVRVDPVDPNRVAARPAQANAGDEEDDTGGMRLYDSIYQTALKQQIPPAIIASMIKIFSNDVDFQQAVQGGDSLDAFYANSDDGDGRQDLLFASVTVRNEIFRYYRFQMPDDPTPEYFDDAGRSMRKFLIRTPVPSGVFTSGFGMPFHPVLGYTRPHTGVDWAAPVGTPILAAGNGTVLKVEHSSSYGNHIEIQHANGYITTYSHMVGFARGMAEGLKVRQGQVIGYLGQTGLATGPHLHYEVIVNGRFVDPMRVKLARSRDIVGPTLNDFKRERARIDALMASAPNAPQAPLQNRASN